MALTSEEVVKHGGQVVEQVNKLAEQMNVFQQRLDGLGDTYEEMSQHMDEREDEIRVAFDSLGETLKGEAKTGINGVGENLETALKTPTIEAIDTFKESLNTEFEKVDASSNAVVDRWQQWRETEMSELMSNVQAQSSSATEGLNTLIESANDDVELMGATAESYVEKSTGLLSDLEGFVEDNIDKIAETQELYGEKMLESYASRMTETLESARELLGDTQVNVTENMFEEVGDQFSELVKSQMIPLIDELVEEVTGAVDSMMEDITNIGDNAKEKSEALGLVTEALEFLIDPIKDIIDRTQGIKDTVDVFI